MKAIIGRLAVPALFWGFITFNVSVEAQSLDPKPILQAFKDSYQWSRHVSLGIESTEFGAEKPDLTVKRDLVLLKDGETRIQTLGRLTHVHRDTGKPFPQENWPDGPFQVLYAEPETDGLLFQSSRMTDSPDEQTVTVFQDGANRLEIERARGDNGGPILGYAFPFSTKHLADLLTAENTTVREETLDGRPCLVLESETPEGHIAVWTSPEEGYALRKCRLIKEAGKHLGYAGNIFEHQNPIFGTSLACKHMIYEIGEVTCSCKRGCHGCGSDKGNGAGHEGKKPARGPCRLGIRRSRNTRRNTSKK